jgi:hypothetical protein
MGMPRYVKVAWGDVEPSDVRESQAGLWSRDCRAYGVTERQYALHVIGSYDASLSLGLVAIRCRRMGELIIPGDVVDSGCATGRGLITMRNVVSTPGHVVA